MVRKMGLENIYFVMEIVMKDNLRVDLNMVKVYIDIQLETIMMVDLKMI